MKDRKKDKIYIILFHMGRFELGVSCLALFIMALLYGIEIASRAIFSSSIVFVQEITMICWIWLVFMTIGFLYKSKRTVTIEFVYNMFPVRMKKVVGLISYIFIMFFCFFIVKTGIDYFNFQKTTTTEVLNLPANLFVIPVIYAGVSIFITSMYDIFIFWIEGEHQKIG
jgi:TRAP-type C4-dicarboxylate transport system permease small subunit